MRFHNIPVRDIMQEAVRYGGVIVDVRTEEEFLRGHIPMAVNVPLSEIQCGNYNLPKHKVLLTYCQYGGYRVINTVGGIVQYKGALTKNR